MKILTVVIKNTKQAKLTLQPGSALIKIPAMLSLEERADLREKLSKIADEHKDTREYLKMYYRIGSPYMFLNKRISNKKRETFKVYNYSEI